MKLMEVTEKKIGEHTFYIRPFSAFVSANLSGELVALITPIIGSLAPLASNANDNFNINDLEIEKVGPVLADAVSGLSGDKVEEIMKKLMINQQTVSVCGPITDGDVKLLDMDLANAIFCGEIQDMFALCFEIIKVNYGGFFSKLGARFGNLPSAFQKAMKNTGASAPLTEAASATSN